MKLSELEIDKMSLPERGLWLQCAAMKLEIATLQSENASLWALAKFGREMLSVRNLSPIPLSDAQMAGLRAVINDLAELCDLLEIDPNSETLVEISLAQLPEKRDG